MGVLLRLDADYLAEDRNTPLQGCSNIIGNMLFLIDLKKYNNNTPHQCSFSLVIN